MTLERAGETHHPNLEPVTKEKNKNQKKSPGQVPKVKQRSVSFAKAKSTMPGDARATASHVGGWCTGIDAGTFVPTARLLNMVRIDVQTDPRNNKPRKHATDAPISIGGKTVRKNANGVKNMDTRHKHVQN